jgi:hypothetical protein
MKPYELHLELTLRAPVLTQAVGALSLGYDMGMLTYDGRPVLLGSLIRGNLRHALLHFAAILDAQSPTHAADLRSFIRAAFGKNPLVDPLDLEGSRLDFDFFWKLVSPEPQPAGPRHRISIDSDTGAAEDRHLVVIECPFPPGEPVTFTGTIRVRCGENDAAFLDKTHTWLSKAAHYLPALGALKGVGFGKLTGAALTPPQPVADGALPDCPTTDGRLGLRLRFDRPLCFAKPHKPDSNVFESETWMPGAALKAVLARSLSEAEKEALRFDRWVVTHGWAVPENKDPLLHSGVLPLSLAWVNRQLVDFALPPEGAPESASCFLLKVDKHLYAPSFQIDWKDAEETEARERLGCPTEGPGRYLVVRTAIQPEVGQSAEGLLFSRDCVDPKGYDWCVDIDLSNLENAAERREAVNRLRRILARPLDGFGKTKARVTEVRPCTPAPLEMPERPLDGHYILTLRTPARLFLEPEGVDPTGGAQALKQLYGGYWREVSGNSLELVRYFARQKRVGGEFFQHRFRHRDEPYRPVWLTEAGSVFVLRVSNEATARDRVRDWLRLGLPQPGDEGHSYRDWRTNPYLRENGYGHIVVNDPVHERFRGRKVYDGRPVTWEGWE